MECLACGDVDDWEFWDDVGKARYTGRIGQLLNVNPVIIARRRNIAARWPTTSLALWTRKCGSSLQPIGCQWHRYTSDLATTKPRAKPKKIGGAKTPPREQMQKQVTVQVQWKNSGFVLAYDCLPLPAAVVNPVAAVSDRAQI
jgi:hypothetical protein